jgi:hypothetical protein
MFPTVTRLWKTRRAEFALFKEKEHNMINFVDAGGVVNNPSAANQNSIKIAELLANTTFQSAADTPAGGPNGEKGGPHIYFPPGNYYFSQPITINKTCYLRGQDAATRAGHQTAFVFPANTQGLIINSHDTNNLSQLPNFSIPGGSGTTVEGIIFKGARGNSYTGHHGILIRAYCVLKNVGTQQFGGHGIYVYANEGDGQASNCMMIGCSAENSAGSGLKIEGNDANIITVTGGDYSNNANWGIEDASGLGCVFTGIHMTGNGGYLTGYCTHNGKRWVLRPNKDSLGGSTEPGTDETVWTECFIADHPYQSDSSKPGYTGWVSGASYKCRGAFITHNISARSVWDGCYTESGQTGSFVNYSAIVTGGAHGAGVYAYDMKSTGQPTFLDHRFGELNFRGNLKTNYLYFGLTRNRGDTVGMKMGAASSIPIYRSNPEPVVGVMNNAGWKPGDIIWNENRTQTQAGVTPPLGWRCYSDDPPAYGQPFRFEEIPFPATGSGSGVIADNSVTNAKLSDMAAKTIKGAVGAGDPQDLSPSQARSVIASDTNNGSLFLAGDGSFKPVPSGGGGITRFEKVCFLGDGTIVWKSPNIASVTRNSVGRYRITFVNGFGSYTISGAAVSLGAPRIVCSDDKFGSGGSTGSYVDIAVFDHLGAYVDPSGAWINLIQ